MGKKLRKLIFEIRGKDDKRKIKKNKEAGDFLKERIIQKNKGKEHQSYKKPKGERER